MKKLLSIFLLLFVGLVAFSQNQFNPDSLLKLKDNQIPHQLVNDFSGVLTAGQQQALETKLVSFNDSTSNQLAVVIIPGLGDYDVSDYSVKLGRAWGIGGKQFSNGVILLVCTDPGNHKVEIATGYGLEGALPDITCKQIIDQVIVPNFKSNDYYTGIDQGTDAIIKATKGEYKASGVGGQNNISLAKVIFLIVVVIVLLAIFSGGTGGGFLGPFLLGNLIGGGFGGGGFGGGGRDSGGGGFGGFGGGSFGGGGASGSW